MTPQEHIAEAERLIARAHALHGNRTDLEGRVILACENAASLAVLATAHAATATAIEAMWARQARGGR